MAKPGNTRVWLGERTRADPDGATDLPFRAEPERLAIDHFTQTVAVEPTSRMVEEADA
jgi:hypothetical protein